MHVNQKPILNFACAEQLKHLEFPYGLGTGTWSSVFICAYKKPAITLAFPYLTDTFMVSFCLTL